MKSVPRTGAKAWLLHATTVAMIMGMLAVGLWPLRFHPVNNVKWLVSRNGIHFGANGSVVSSDKFRVPPNGPDNFCSLEVWLAPAFSSAAASIVVVSTPSNPLQLQLTQSLADLFVIQRRTDPDGRIEMKHMVVASLFQKERSAFVSISGDAKGTTIFIDGMLRRHSSDVRLTCASLDGTLVLANSPERYDPWQGNVLALAIYHRSLDAASALRHYRAFSSGAGLDRSDLQSALAVYDFSEHAGRVVRDQAGSEPGLIIPEYYSILYPRFLTPPWKEYTPNRWYLTDLTINVVGFIPAGFFICASLISLRNGKRSVALTALIGLTLSLTIEILQAYIPMRNSGCTDLISNTLGTAIGAALCFYLFKERDVLQTR
jgi:VanZ family protein